MIALVFVDEAIFPYKGKLYCHMFCSDTAKLHSFAQQLGIKRCWFENKRGRYFPHYDITSAQRDMAINFGAIPVTGKEMVELQREYKNEIQNIQRICAE